MGDRKVSDKDEKKGDVLPLYLSEQEKERNMDLLMIEKRGDESETYIKQTNASYHFE